MRNLILLIIVTLCHTLNAQTESTKDYSYGFQVFPNVSFPSVRSTGPVFNPKNYNPKFCISGGWFGELRITHYFAFGMGIGYMNTGSQTEKIPLIFNTQSGPSAEPLEVRVVYNNHNVEIPIYAKFFFAKRLHAFVGASGLLNLHNTNKVQYYELNGPKTKSETQDDTFDGYRNLNANAFVGFGVDYFQGQKISLFVDLKGQLGILGITKDTPISLRYLSLGLSTGIRL